MTELIKPGTQEHLIDPAYDKFLDGVPKRRELQATFHKIGIRMTEIMEGLDTQALVGNFLCDKLNVTREEIDAYVKRKAEEIKTQQEDALKNGVTSGEANNAQPNS